MLHKFHKQINKQTDIQNQMSVLDPYQSSMMELLYEKQLIAVYIADV